MPQDPFPDPDDGEEPDGSVPPEDQDGPGQQGLFLCLPAEEFDPDRFAQSGPAPDLPPGGDGGYLDGAGRRAGRLRCGGVVG
jgi:hypothetical protein